jgi:hypothetical protein
MRGAPDENQHCYAPESTFNFTLGPFNPIIALLIATIKATLVGSLNSQQFLHQSQGVLTQQQHFMQFHGRRRCGSARSLRFNLKHRSTAF